MQQKLRKKKKKEKQGFSRSERTETVGVMPRLGSKGTCIVTKGNFSNS
jgi:hypothetical protein